MRIGGHRGMGVTDAPGRSGPYQENSLAAIERAFALGADFVEVDWVWDREGVGWICHSSVLDQHFDAQAYRYLDQMSTDEVRQLIGKGGHPLVSLQQLIEQFGGQAVNVEIKGLKGAGRDPAEFWQQAIPDQWPASWWLSSFDPSDLLHAQRIWPNTPVGLLSAEAGGVGDLYRGGPSYLTGHQALAVLDEHPDWLWHPELTDRPSSERTQVGWSIDPASELQYDLTGLSGLITDRVDAWC